MDTKGIIMWAVFILICAANILTSKRMKKQIEENGIETGAVVSRITDSGEPDEISVNYYVTYTTEDGKEIEGILSNPRSDLEIGQKVKIKYHPKYKENARLA